MAVVAAPFMPQDFPVISGDPPLDDNEIKERRPASSSGIAFVRMRLGRFAETAHRGVGIVTAHPLLVGGVLLFIFGGLVGSSSLGVVDTVRAANLGGADVEEVIVPDAYRYSAIDEYLIREAPLFGGNTDTAIQTTLAADDIGLVTVPWTPVPPPGSSRHDVAVYTVADGDTMEAIAARFGVSLLSVAISNNVADPDSIKPGDTFRIPPPVSDAKHVFLYTVKSGDSVASITKHYAADTSAVISLNGLPATGALTQGAELVVPVNATPEFALPKPPAPKPIVSSAAKFATSQVPLGYYIAPTSGHNYGRIHSNNGVDIANTCGTPVYAAAAGTLITEADYGPKGQVLWGGGYGVHILIKHPNGTETRYAHLSEIIVHSGQVAQGQLIGLMGTTGRSTGCHLHFEVHGARNPLGRY